MPLRPFPLPGLVVERVSTAEPTLLSDAHASTPAASCPDGHTPSARVHSRSTRHLRALPGADSPVRLREHVRRFRCATPTCPRRTFPARLPALAPCHAQRPARLPEAVRGLGGEAGGAAGARMATRRRMSLSGDTVLRMLRGPPAPAQRPPRVLGLEDFALRTGRVYGTIRVARAPQRPIDVRPERTADAVAPWWWAPPGIEVMARERASD